MATPKLSKPTTSQVLNRLHAVQSSTFIYIDEACEEEEEEDENLADAGEDKFSLLGADCSDLNLLIYSFLMLIVEGRHPTPHTKSANGSEIEYFARENVHPRQSIRKLQAKILDLCSKSGDFANNSRQLLQEANCDKRQHQCCSDYFQCRIAAKLSIEIEKCARKHLSKDAFFDDESHTDEERANYHAKNEALSITSNCNNKKIPLDLNNNDILPPNSFTNIQIDVYLLAECCFNELAYDSDQNFVLLDLNYNNNSCNYYREKLSDEQLLLESWTISMITNKTNSNSSFNNNSINNNNNNNINNCGTVAKSLANINDIFQAIRSYLHFSQISSWINQTKGKEPKRLAFSISYKTNKNLAPEIEPQTKGLKRQNSDTFDFHSFPSLNFHLINNKFALQSFSNQQQTDTITCFRIDLYSRKRDSLLIKQNFNSTNTNINRPHLICTKFDHRMNRERSENTDSNAATTTTTTTTTTTGDEALSSSARQSLNILNDGLLYLSEQQLFKKHLPHWSPVRMTPIVLDLSRQRRCSLEIKKPKSDSIMPNILSRENTMNESSTDFCPPPSFSLSKRQEYQEEDSKIRSSGTTNDLLLISESPKVLMSTHRAFDQDLRIESTDSNTSDNYVKKFALEQKIDHNLHDHKNTNENYCLPIKLNESTCCPFVSDKTLCNNKLKESAVLLLTTKTLPRKHFPLSSSPAPIRKCGSAFDFDTSLKHPKAIKNAFINENETLDKNNNINNNNNDEALNCAEASFKQENEAKIDEHKSRSIHKCFSYSNANLNTPLPLTPASRLLCNFEESLLNGRMNPAGLVDGFYAEIGASGSFFPDHATLPVRTTFYQVCDDDLAAASSPYLGILDLSALSNKRGYKVPNRGTIQVTLFNPNKTVVKMFVVMYDLSDMPANNRTFLRQRTMYVPVCVAPTNHENSNNNNIFAKSYLRYLIHLRFATSKSGKMYLHSNIKLIFARNKCEIDPRLAKYEYKTVTEAPRNPKYSSKK